MLARIELAIRAKNFDKALDLTNSYIIKFPDDWKGYYEQARVNMIFGHYDEARELLTKLMEEAEHLQPDQGSVMFSLAKTYSFPALRALATTETRMESAEINNHIEQIRKANDIFAKIPATEETMPLQQLNIGMNIAEIGKAYLRLSRKYKTEAEIAETAGLEDQKLLYQDQAQAASKEADELCTG